MPKLIKLQGGGVVDSLESHHFFLGELQARGSQWEEHQILANKHQSTKKGIELEKTQLEVYLAWEVNYHS